MNKLERLEQEAFEAQVAVHKYDLGEPSLKGLYMNGHIALSDKLETTAEKSCILAEELGHHYTSIGNILNTSDLRNCKQERRARLWAYDKQIGLNGLIDAHEHHCRTYHEVAEHLDVTTAFLKEALDCYREKYGTGTSQRGYYIMFIPHLMIGKIIQ